MADDAADELVRLAASIDDRPTLAQIDQMLALISRAPRCPANEALADGLLEMRPGTAAAEHAAA